MRDGPRRRLYLGGCALAALTFGCGAGGGDDGVAVAADILGDGDGGTATGSDAPATAEGATDVATDADPFAGAPAPICFAPSDVDGKTPLFVDATAEFGLVDDARALGIRISAADLNGDHYPEILVRRNVIGERSDPSALVTRHFSLLRNVAAPEGGRRLVDGTAGSGLLATRDGKTGRPCHVAIAGDIDDDGDNDVFCGMYVSLEKPGDVTDHSEWLANDGTGAFGLVGGASPFVGEARRALTSATLVDYDRDGDLDLWLGTSTWGQSATADLLFANDGDGGYTDVSQAEGLMTLPPTLSTLASGKAHRNTWGTGACDLNGDGHPELYTTSYGRYYNGLWQGGGLGGGMRFADVMLESGFSRDDDDDWRSNWNAQCYCAENPKAAECGSCPKPAINCAALKQSFGGTYRWNHATDREPWRLGGVTAGAVCADLDRDGKLDVVQWNIVHSDVGPSADPTHVMRNLGGEVPKFQHIAPSANGLQRTWPELVWNEGDMSGAVGDLDLDGRLDLVIASSDYPGTRLFVWLQQSDGTFAQLPAAQAPDHPRAAGLALVDLDLDGDLDLVVGSSRARCSGAAGADCPAEERVRVWRNVLHGPGVVGAAGAQGNWLAISLDGGGAGCSRSAIGARVEVDVGGTTLVQELGGGYGHFGQQNGLTLHFGLGAACEVAAVRVRWPDAAGSVETFSHVRANQLVRLRRGEPKVRYPLAP